MTAGEGLPVVAVVGVAAILIAGLIRVWSSARRRRARDGNEHRGEEPVRPAGGTAGLEDPLVAAMGRAADGRSRGPTWRIAAPRRGPHDSGDPPGDPLTDTERV